MTDERRATCPCCGGPVEPNDLLVDLNTNTATRLGVTVKLSPQNTELLFAMQKAGIRTLPKDALVTAIYGAGQAPENFEENRSITVLLSRLRRLIAPLGVAIAVTYKIGWRLVYFPEPVPLAATHPRLAFSRAGKRITSRRGAYLSGHVQ